METFAARLASFDSVVPAINSRTSSSRNIQPQRWVWDSPSPEQLAHAGFYFQPYDTNPDNTMCFLCGRALDGWEEGDDPVTEHLKHSPDCGWAIIMDIQSKTSNPAEIVDPTSSAIVEARRATFGVGWPHEGKRGWLCQSEKMVEAGWYFCPNEESPDLASCPYCKLSLDGWEEADDPFEEHHRRSSDCSFFVFALPGKTTKKNTRAKKPRASKASRLSTQSVMTTASEAPTIDDDMMDISMMSQSTVKSQSTKKAKTTRKTTKSRAKKSKKDEPTEIVDDVETEQTEQQMPEPEQPKRPTRGKKRGSEVVVEEMSAMKLTDPAVDTEPAPKRRARETRRSVSQQPEELQSSVLADAPLEVATSPVMPKKGRKGTKKTASTRSRKASTALSSGKTTQGRIADDSVLEAAIEADLARNMEDTEPFEFHYKDEERESARFRQQSISTSIKAPSESPYEREETPDAQDTQEPAPEEEPSLVEVIPEPKQKKQPKRKAPAKKSKKEKALESEPEPEHSEINQEQAQEVEHEREPELEAESATAEPDHEDEAEAADSMELVKAKPKRTSQQKRPNAQKQSAEEEASLIMVEVEPNSRQSAVHDTEIEAEDLHPEVDEANEKQSIKKSGKKAAKGRKPAASKRKESDIVMDEAEAAESHETASEALKPQRRESQRKSKDVTEVSMILDEQEDVTSIPAQEEPVKQPTKAKRGRPAKEESVIVDGEDSVPAPAQEEPVVQPIKAKRGRPTKESKEAPEEKQEVEAKPRRGRPSKQRSIQADELPEENKSQQQAKKAEVPAKNTQRYSDLPKDRHRAQSFIESVTNSSPQRPSPNNTHSTTQERTPSPSPQASDAENQPPSTRPRSARPPILSPTKPSASRLPFAATTPSPSKRQAEGFLTSSRSWEPMDIEELLSSFSDKENRDLTLNQDMLKEILTSPEKKMTVEEWIYFNAKSGEERLRRECERLISIFEREGGRAMRALEGIECVD